MLRFTLELFSVQTELMQSRAKCLGWLEEYKLDQLSPKWRPFPEAVAGMLWSQEPLQGRQCKERLIFCLLELPALAALTYFGD